MLCGAGIAAIPDSAGAIHACIDSSSGKIRVLDSGKGQSCKSSETPVVWTNTPPVAAAAGMIWRGSWSSTTAYAANDVVSYGASTYVAIAASTGIQPLQAKLKALNSSGHSWTILGGVGAQGPPGPPGPAGSASATGSGGSGGDLVTGVIPGTQTGSTPTTVKQIALAPGRYFLFAHFTADDRGRQ